MVIWFIYVMIANTTIVTMEMNATICKTTASGVQPVLMDIMMIIIGTTMMITNVPTLMITSALTMTITTVQTTVNLPMMVITTLPHSSEEDLCDLKKILGTLHHHQEAKKIHHFIQILMIYSGFSLNKRLILLSGNKNIFNVPGYECLHECLRFG